MSKPIRLSPSKMGQANRCVHSVALSVLADEKGASGIQAPEEDKTWIAQGYFFEQMLTGKRPKFREEPRQESYMAYLDRAQKNTLNKLSYYAQHLKEMYLPTSGYNTGEFLEWITPEMEVVGELDLRIPNEGGSGHDLIIDIKLMKSMFEVLDPTGKLYDTSFMIQPPTYSMLDAVAQSKKPEALYQAACAYLLADIETAMGHMAEFVAGVRIARCAFLVCDPKDMGTTFDPTTQEETQNAPLHRLLEIEFQGDDMLHLASEYLATARLVRTMVLANNKAHPAIANAINPDEARCLGRGRFGKHSGMCPWVGSCCYGQRHFGKSSINFKSLYQA